jgi:tetraacyldisaccharide 4'-kinase
VLVCADRHLAGRLAERRFGTDVCLLDDGFQHWQLARDVDLLLVSPADLDEQLLPFGRLREPLSAARAADAVLVPGAPDVAARVGDALGHSTVFHLQIAYERPALLQPFGAPFDDLAGGDGRSDAIAVAAIARPRRFFDAVANEGWNVRREISYRDHHWFSRRDIERIAALASDVGAPVILTTEKDAVRLEHVVGTRGGPTWAFVPMHVSIEPVAAFREWLLARLSAA